jgi:hypothetical protein
VGGACDGTPVRANAADALQVRGGGQMGVWGRMSESGRRLIAWRNVQHIIVKKIEVLICINV